MSESSASVGNGESGNELWQGVPMDILINIASRLTSTDHAALRSSCKSWPAILSNVPAPHHPNPLPFLLLPSRYTLQSTPPTSRYPSRNNIYFTDVYRKVVNNQVISVGCVYVFDLEQGVTTKAFEVAETDEVNMWTYLRPWWVTPNLRRRDP